LYNSVFFHFLGGIKVQTYCSLSSRFLLQILIAVCLTRLPRQRLLTTMPLTSGMAIVNLNNKKTIYKRHR